MQIAAQPLLDNTLLEHKDKIHGYKNIILAAVIVAVAALAAWQFGLFGEEQTTTMETTPPPAIEAPATTGTPPQPAPATPPATTTTQ